MDRVNLSHFSPKLAIPHDIVANMALNRVATSLTGAELDKFKKDLEEAQHVRTMYGNTIADPPVKLPKEKGDELGLKKPGKRGHGKRPRPNALD